MKKMKDDIPHFTDNRTSNSTSPPAEIDTTEYNQPEW
jgi:hypothetical protein